METLIVTLHQALPSPSPQEEGLPGWLQLTPAGTFSGADGRGPFRVANPAALIERSMRSGKLVLDECHATDLAAPKGGPAPARGWIVELAERQDGIWGRVEWTKTGGQLVSEHAYRGISPVFERDKAGNLIRILRASLTNDPNLPIKTLNHKDNPSMDDATLAALREKLGLPDADAATLLAKIGELGATQTAQTEKQGDVDPAKGDVAAKADVSGSVVAPPAVTAETNARQNDLRVVELQAQITELQSQRAREIGTRVIDDAIRAGKPIMPLRDHYIERHCRDPQSVETELAGLPSINAGGIATPPQEINSETLTAEETKIVELMGVDPAEYIKTRKGMAEAL